MASSPTTDSCYWPEIEIAAAEKRHEVVLSGDVIKIRLADAVRERSGKEKSNPPTSLPSELFNLVDLNFLEVSRVCLDRLSPEIGKLSSLSTLVLRKNSLLDLPAEMGGLLKLKHFDLSENQLSSLPQTLSNLCSLQVFNVSYNQVEDLPDLSKSCDLVDLNAAYNKISDFPEWLLKSEDSFIHLNSLSFRGNQISELPSNIGNLSSSLRILDLSENKITVIPGELGDCARLKDLFLSDNRLKDRRLIKLINDQHSKMHAVLEYVRKSCPRIAGSHVSAGGGKGKKKKKAGAKKPVSDNNETPSNDGEPTERIFVQKPTPGVEIVLSQEAAKIRPHLVCCIVRGLDLQKDKALKSFLQAQNRLHDSEKACNKRVACTIATHDLSKVKFPLHFKTEKPENILITPLLASKEVTGEELVARLNEEAEQLRKKEKRNTYSGIHKYLHLLKDLKEYPCFEDSEGKLISFPPITNSDLTKMELETEDLLLEVSGSQDQAVCKRVMDALVTEIFKLDLMKLKDDDDDQPDVKELLLEQVKVLNEQGAVHVTYPDKSDLKIENLEVIRSWEHSR